MKKSEKQAVYLFPKPRTPGRFPDPRSRLTKKRKGSQGKERLLREKTQGITTLKAPAGTRGRTRPESRTTGGPETMVEPPLPVLGTRRTPAPEPPVPGQTRGLHSPRAILQPLSPGAEPSKAPAK